MDDFLFQSYKIEERSYVAFIKREIHNLVAPHFTKTRAAEIDIIISELTSNLVKHAGKGELLYRIYDEKGEKAFEALCVDHGPGIRDVNQAMKDGVSTRNTLGQGLGAIARLSNLSQVYSLSGWGTIVYSRCYQQSGREVSQEAIQARGIILTKPGESVSGDAVSIRRMKGRTMVFVADGLGHGIHAREAAETGITIFRETTSHDPSEIIREMNVGLRKTRGLVGTVAVLDHQARRWQLCGVGNISTRLHQGIEHRNYICNNGIIGLNIPSRLVNSTLAQEKSQHLIFCSDGIKTRWSVLQYPAILKYDPIMLAAAVYKDHARMNDDMTVLIVKVT